MAAVSEAFDLVILGAGSGGYACALRAAELGLRVALVERDKVGGTCLHRGCIPTKAVLHAAEVADSARSGSQFGVHSSIDKIDLAGVRSYADSVVGRLHQGLTGLISSRGITVVPGEGRLVRRDGEVAVAVGDQIYEGSRVVLASGSYARTLPGLEVDQTQVLTSDGALGLETLPESAIVLGGGVIGVEFASAWRSFGVDVTILEALPRLLPSEEPEISQSLERAYRKRGITCLTGRRTESVHRHEGGVTATLDDGRTLSAELLLVAVGRGPASGGLGYAEAGVQLDRGYVEVDDRLQTSLAGVYAVGDLVGGLQLAHRGFAHGLFVAEDIAFGLGRLDSAPTPVSDVAIPRVAYCEPEVASVGLSEAAAREAYGEVETVRLDLAGNGRSQILKTSGLVKLVRAPHGPVVGISMIGSRVSELIAEAQLITSWEAYPSDVASLVHPHPTQSEAIGEAHLALAGKPLHVHG